VHRTFWWLFPVVAACIACGKPSEAPRASAGSAAAPVVATPAPPPPVRVTTATFEPVYRAAKAVQGATESGVTLIKYGELLQAFSTEISIAKDHDLNEQDKKLLAIYEEAFGHYQVSASLWRMKINASDDLWKGEIPVFFNDKPNETMVNALRAYDIPVEDREMSLTHARYRAAPGDAPQRVWSRAAASVEQASALFYGKAAAQPDR
jgi:hypothetical protein